LGSEGPLFLCQGLRAAYDGVEVLRGVDLRVDPGEMVGIIGQNGSGKSTLLRVLSGVIEPSGGQAWLAGRDARRLRARERARLVGVVEQQSAALFAFPVWDMVAMGRHAHLAPLQGLGEADRAAVRQALTRTDTMHLKDRLITELSGGELQRAVIARALAQEPRALLLDEPTNHLDINHQLDIARMLRELNRERGLTVIWVSHDLNLAAEFCERIVVIHEGAVAADGTPAEVIRAEMLEAVYGVRVPVVANPLSGRPQVVLVGEEGAP
jgi:iron complex transport system ATP-binding protein